MKINFTPTRIRTIKPGKTDRMIWDKATPHFALRIRPNGTKRYIHVYTDPKANKHFRKTIGDPQVISLERARSIAERLNTEIGVEKEQKPSSPFFADYANDVWMPKCAEMVKASSLARSRLALDNQLLPAFGHLRLDEITKPVILKWFTRYSEKYPGGANRTIYTLATILNQAVRAGLIERSPANGIIRNPRRRMTRFLSDEERQRLLEALDNAPPEYQDHADTVRLLLFTGCRSSEIAKLRWSEVGVDRINLADSKTGPRAVWLSDEAIELLDDLRRRRSGNSEFVFPQESIDRRYKQGIRRNKCSWYSQMVKFWVDLREEMDLPGVRFHDLRHSFATQAIRQGIPLPVVSKLLGHHKLDMTMRYTHASDTDAEEAAERVGEQISGLLIGRDEKWQ